MIKCVQYERRERAQGPILLVTFALAKLYVQSRGVIVRSAKAVSNPCVVQFIVS